MTDDTPAAASTPREGTALGRFLRDRRQRVDAQALGFGMTRRRTPGLRREEVAQRAHISATWYTWLEQGRGGAPSAEVLRRISAALMLTDAEREHLFLLGLGRPPEAHYAPLRGDVTPRLQRVLDALLPCPALIKTATWDVVAWNRAAARTLTDYGALPVPERNVLRLMFRKDRVRTAQSDWLASARFVVATFRADVARAGASAQAQALVDELTRESSEFAALWREQEVRYNGEGLKQLNHAELGPLFLEYTAFAVDARPDLAMLVFLPADDTTKAKISTLLQD
jgi:transcriptional regulator with XRE-family HTH domain